MIYAETFGIPIPFLGGAESDKAWFKVSFLDSAQIKFLIETMDNLNLKFVRHASWFADFIAWLLSVLRILSKEHKKRQKIVVRITTDAGPKHCYLASIWIQIKEYGAGC